MVVASKVESELLVFEVAALSLVAFCVSYRLPARWLLRSGAMEEVLSGVLRMDRIGAQVALVWEERLRE